MRFSRRILPVMLTGLLTAACATAAAGPAKPGVKPGAKPGTKLETQVVPQMVDQDRNKIFDTLDKMLKQADDKQRLPVLVMATRPTDVAEMEKVAGPIALKYQYQVVPAVAASLTRDQVDILARQTFIHHIEYDETVRAALDGATQWFGARQARQDFGVDGNRDGSPGFSRDDIVVSAA